MIYFEAQMRALAVIAIPAQVRRSVLIFRIASIRHRRRGICRVPRVTRTWPRCVVHATTTSQPCSSIPRSASLHRRCRYTHTNARRRFLVGRAIDLNAVLDVQDLGAFLAALAT